MVELVAKIKTPAPQASEAGQGREAGSRFCLPLFYHKFDGGKAMTITEKIMEAIAEDVQEMMCRDCPHAEHSESTFFTPEWNDCPGEGEPWDGGCRRHDEYEAVEERVKECEQDIQVIIFGRVCAKCQKS